MSVGIRPGALQDDEIEAALWERLAENGRPCLWIVDDLPSGLDLQEVEKRWRAQWTGASTLITTRCTDYGAFGRCLDLDLLSAAEAWQLLTSHRKPEVGAEEIAAKEILQELGGHPLAIEVASSYLAKGTQKFNNYLEELRNPQQDALEYGAELRECLPTGHERSIAGTMLKSIRLAGKEGMDFLRLASVLAVAPISLPLLETVFELADPRIPGWLLDAWFEVSRVSANSRIQTGSSHWCRLLSPGIRMRLLRALDDVDSLGLASKAADGARTVHPLVSRTFRYHTRTDRRTARLRVAAAHALSRLLPVVVDIRQHERLTAEMAHARHMLCAGISTIADAEVGRWVSEHDYQRGDYATAEKLQVQLLEARQQLQGNDHPDTLTAADRLAVTLREKGEWEKARQLFEQVLKARQRRQGKEAAATLTAESGLALTLAAQGDLRRARRLLEHALEGRRRLHGNEHPATLITVQCLAQVLHKQGHLTEAQRLQEEVLETKQRVLGEENSDTLTAANDLAFTLLPQGELVRARGLFERVLDTRRRIEGRHHPYTTTAAWGLLRTVRKNGDFEMADRFLAGDLQWLLERSPESLPRVQKSIRQDLSDLLSRPET